VLLEACLLEGNYIYLIYVAESLSFFAFKEWVKISAKWVENVFYSSGQGHTHNVTGILYLPRTDTK
jgi:hypothetical protein